MLCHKMGNVVAHRKVGPNVVPIGPIREWLKRCVYQIGMTQLVWGTDIPERIIYRAMYEQTTMNFYKADEILTKLNGPSVFTLYPEWRDYKNEGA